MCEYRSVATTLVTGKGLDAQGCPEIRRGTETHVDVDYFRCISSVQNAYGDPIVAVSATSSILSRGNTCRTSMGKHLVCCFRIEEIDNQSDTFTPSTLARGGFDATAASRNARTTVTCLRLAFQLAKSHLKSECVL